MIRFSLGAHRGACGIRARLAVAGAVAVIAAGALASAVAASGPVTGRTTEVAQVGAAAPASSSSVARSSRFLVRWAAGAPPVATENLTTAEAGSVRRIASTPGRIVALRVATGHLARFVRVTSSGAAVYDQGTALGTDAATTLARIAAIPGVRSVEPDPWLTIDAAPLPTDVHSRDLWGLTDPAVGIDVLNAWATTDPPTIGAGVTVAVIDTGIVHYPADQFPADQFPWNQAPPDHPDLAGVILPGFDMISDAETARDGQHPYATAANPGDDRDPDPTDPGDWCPAYGDPSSWHGTHVAGTIAAIPGNGIGVFGGAPGARILPVRALGQCGGYTSDVADAIRWAAVAPSGGEPVVPGVPNNPNPARVLNLSLGGSGACEPEMASAIAAARASGAVVVVAAGNESTNAARSSPGNCPGAFTVAATAADGGMADFSNFGRTVDIAAPGVDIWSTVDSGFEGPVGPTYAAYDGTSMAAPHVAAVAALILSVRPGLTPAEVETLIRATAAPFPATAVDPCVPGVCGAGIANAARALAGLSDATAPGGSVSFPAFRGPSPATPDPKVSLALTAADPETGVAEVEISGDGAAWKTFDASASITWDLTATAYGGSADPGLKSVYVRWRNGAGVASSPVVRTIEYLAAPVAALRGLPPWSTTSSLAVAWGAVVRVAGTTLTGYDVRYRRAAWNGNFGAWHTWLASTPAAAHSFAGQAGSTYCFAARARDSRGVASAWTAASCAAIPLDDRSLGRSRGWSARRAANYFGGTLLSTRTHNAVLTRTGVVARRIAILAKTCPACGTVEVRLDGVLLKRISLAGARVGRQVFAIAAFAVGRRGTLAIRVTSYGKPVVIDGVLIGRD